MEWILFTSSTEYTVASGAIRCRPVSRGADPISLRAFANDFYPTAWKPGIEDTTGGFEVLMPFCCLLALAAMPTYVLWRLDHRLSREPFQTCDNGCDDSKVNEIPEGDSETGRRGLLRLGKWVGLGLSTTVAVGWVAAVFLFVCVSTSHGNICFSDGCVELASKGGRGPFGICAWFNQQRDVRLLPGYEHWDYFDYTKHLYVPMWCILLAVAIPTLVLWRVDRRQLHGRCRRCWRCGYNLTGNTSGVCPECGEPA